MSLGWGGQPLGQSGCRWRRFFARNLREPIEGIGTFDFIYCQEVLHHTGDAKESFDNLVKILEPNGEIAIYVYKQKAPIREYTDDFVREKIKGLSYEDSMKACRQITELGKALHDLKVKIQIPQVDILGIEAGEYDLQRFIYHHFAKIFWNDEFKFEDNAVINYDWYHPQDCTRHTLDEVSTWFESNNLKIVQLDAFSLELFDNVSDHLIGFIFEAGGSTLFL